MFEEMDDDEFFLREPNTAFDSGKGSKNGVSYYYGSMQGWRKTMVR